MLIHNFKKAILHLSHLLFIFDNLQNEISSQFLGMVLIDDSRIALNIWIIHIVSEHRLVSIVVSVDARYAVARVSWFFFDAVEWILFSAPTSACVHFSRFCFHWVETFIHVLGWCFHCWKHSTFVSKTCCCLKSNWKWTRTLFWFP